MLTHFVLVEVLKGALADIIALHDNRAIAHASTSSVGEAINCFVTLFRYPVVECARSEARQLWLSEEGEGDVSHADRRNTVWTAFPSMPSMKAMLVVSSCPNLYSALVQLMKIPLFAEGFCTKHLEKLCFPGYSTVREALICVRSGLTSSPQFYSFVLWFVLKWYQSTAELLGHKPEDLTAAALEMYIIMPQRRDVCVSLVECTRPQQGPLGRDGGLKRLRDLGGVPYNETEVARHLAADAKYISHVRRAPLAVRMRVLTLRRFQRPPRCSPPEKTRARTVACANTRMTSGW